VPLVISMHGFAGWPARQAESTHWNQLADEEGFIVVYPAGTSFPMRWSSHQLPGAADVSMKDVVFISDLIDHLEQEYAIDPERIYANGFSNGGGMSFLLSCALSERIAAIGTVSGAFLYDWDACQPARPVPLIAFHGTADPVVPFAGGRSTYFDLPFPAVSDWVQAYAAHNGCAQSPEALPAGTEVRGAQYSGCAQNADVVFYTVEGGGHTWPGGPDMLKFITGPTCHSIDASRLMWDFFEQHPL
jgi:polyhydroxybutyrate depolymerase